MPEDESKMLSIFGYPIASESHRLFIAVARTVVNNDGKESSADPSAWSSGTLSQEAGTGSSVWDLAWLLGSTPLWTRGWQGWCTSSSALTMLQGGLTLLACWLSLLLFWGLCIGPSSVDDLGPWWSYPSGDAHSV